MDNKNNTLDLGVLDSTFNTIEGCIAYCKGFIVMDKYTEVKFQYNYSNYVLIKC